MVERRVLLGMKWQEGQPLVRVRDDGQASSRLEPLLGLDLAYRVDLEGARTCIGHKPFRSGGADYVDCVQRPQSTGPTCRTCAIVEATFASNLHHAHTKESVGLDPAMAAHLRQPNLLYLAAFRDGSIKVGTSTEKRIETRLTEQGAWRASIVARAPDGVTIRVLEDAVTAMLGLPQSVSAVRKMAGLVSPRPDEALLQLLADHRRTIHELITGSVLAVPDAFTTLDQEWSFAGADDNRWRLVHAYPADLSSGAHELTVDAACGRLVLLRRPSGNDRFVADLRRLFGRVLDWGQFGSAPLTVQDALF